MPPTLADSQLPASAPAAVGGPASGTELTSLAHLYYAALVYYDIVIRDKRGVEALSHCPRNRFTEATGSVTSE